MYVHVGGLHERCPSHLTARQFHVHQQCCRYRPVRPDLVGIFRSQAYLRSRRTAGLRPRRLSVKGREELYLPVVDLHEQEGRAPEQNPSDASRRVGCHGYESERPVYRHRIRDYQSEGSVDLAESGSAHLDRTSGFPRSAH